jgi:hypothetical protein
MTERRFESRFLCADLVKVEWMADASDVDNGSAGSSRTVEGVLEDISALGACVQVEERIPLGTKLLVSVVAEETARLSGFVSYCVYRDYGYFVGLRFSNETRWSSGVFEPQHLTNLGALMEPPNAVHN